MSKIIRQEHTKKNPVNNDDIDFTEADSLTETQIESGANNDPDSKPFSDEELKHVKIKRRGSRNG